MNSDNTPSAASGWRKATYSTSNGSCVEAAQTPAGVAVRDTTDRDGGALEFSAAAWQSFTGGLTKA
jgi:hypothetical protein